MNVGDYKELYPCGGICSFCKCTRPIHWDNGKTICRQCSEKRSRRRFQLACLAIGAAYFPKQA